MACLFVSFFTESDAFYNAVEFNFTCNFRDYYIIERIPCTNDFTFLNVLAIFHYKCCTVRNVIGDEQTVVFKIHCSNLTCTAYYDWHFITFIIYCLNST